MTPKAFNKIRMDLDMTWQSWGEALGFPPEHARTQAHRYFRGEYDIPRPVARLAVMLHRYGIPEDLGKAADK
jgi:hypothetical protein